MATQIELPTTIHVESAVSSDLAAALVRIGVDKATIYATLGNIVSVAIGPLTVALIATKLSPDLQGYYYTFGSVANVQFILEAGLSQTIIQFVSHEWPGLMMNATGVFNGDEGSKLRLVRLGRLHFGWNMISAVLLCVVLVGAGELLFPGGVLPPTEWRAPWIAFCLTVVMNFFISPTWALLQGCNQVSEYWLFRMIQQLVNGATLCAALAAGAGLWSLSIAGGMNLIWAMLFLRTRYPDFHRNFLTTGAHAPSWRTDIWPVQWRVALSWIASYITTQLFAPIVFRLSGPVDAGRVGMTSTIGLILLALSTNPVVTKATTFGMLSASGRNK
jgi:O-antigen/teichoic acid export membrane protein